MRKKRYLFLKKYRLTGQPQFDRVFSQRMRVRNQHFLIHYANNGLPYSRLGIMIGRRLIRYAVIRNMLKRLIRESFRRCQLELVGLDIVVRVTRRLSESMSKEAPLKTRKSEISVCVDTLLARLIKQRV